jgi:MoaA/NifB/PqqE/SkfB family radical SAM enzyme
MQNNSFRHIKARLRLPLEVIRARFTRTYKPLVILLYVTDRCNLQCKYCVGNWSARKINDFTTQEIKKIIDECEVLGTCHFTIHGGEILLRNDTAEIINYLKNKKFYVNLVTNGILLPEKIDEVMKVDSLCISLDGREANNDFNRGNGSYKKIMKAIRLAKERGLKFNVQATLTKKNLQDIEYLAALAKEIGYYQQFSLLLKPLESSQQQDWGLTEEESGWALKEIIRVKKQGFPVFTSYRVLQNAINWLSTFDKVRLNKDEIPQACNVIRCFYGKLKIAIDADGFAYPCSSLNDSFKALNVRDAGVKKAYEHILSTNTCEACFYLTQNDWNLFLGGSLSQFLHQASIQLTEVFNIFR